MGEKSKQISSAHKEVHMLFVAFVFKKKSNSDETQETSHLAASATTPLL